MSKRDLSALRIYLDGRPSRRPSWLTPAVGGMFAALNTMYSAMSASIREEATLRAIGCAGSSVLVAFLPESLRVSLREL